MTPTCLESLPETVTQFLPDTVEYSKTIKVRALLGNAVCDMPDSQLETFIAQCEYLIDCWLDEYEQQLFGGKTLREVLHEK